MVKRSEAALAALLLLVLTGAFFYFRGHGLIGDEKNPLATASVFAGSHFDPRIFWDTRYQFTSAWPTYGMLLGLFCMPLGGVTPASARTVTFLLSLLCIAVCWRFDKKLHPDEPRFRTAHAALSPVIFPFLFLLYPEPLSLLFVVAMFYFASPPGRLAVSGWMGILSVLLRQNNIAWMACAWAMSKKKSWVFLGAFLAFAVFVFVNGGVAMRDKHLHPVSIHTGNIFFGLFTFFWMFLPLIAAEWKKCVELLKRPAVLFGLLALLILYVATFHVDHPHNQPHLKYYFHNKVLMYATRDAVMKSLFFLCAALGAVSLGLFRFKDNQGWILLLFSILFLLPSWLIEIRYLYIPFALFMLMREKKSDRAEWTLCFYNLAWSAFFLYRMQHKLFLP